MGLMKLIAHEDAGSSRGRGADLLEEGVELPEELKEVEKVLCELRNLYFVVFMYYASTGNDLMFWYLNQWIQFVEDCKISDNKSKFLKKSDLDRLFIAVDTKAAMTQQAIQEAVKNSQELKKNAGDAFADRITGADHDDLQKKKLGRVEFLVCLVHIAINRYVLSGMLTDVAPAIKRLLVQDIKPLLSPKIFVDPNKFRKKYCYRREIDDVLKPQEASLRNLFTSVCTTGGAGLKAKHMLIHEFIGVLRLCDIVGVDVTEREAAMSFAWSRMCVIDECTKTGRRKESTLPFEGFLEGLVRISMLKALPTDQQIAEYECTNAFQYFAKLRLNDEEAFQKMMVSGHTIWGDEPKTQPVPRCVNHVVDLILNKVTPSGRVSALTGKVDLTEAEANAWAKKNASVWGL
jgi:hypothetical protein